LDLTAIQKIIMKSNVLDLEVLNPSSAEKTKVRIVR
jgi:hypothetical protein